MEVETNQRNAFLLPPPLTNWGTCPGLIVHSGEYFTRYSSNIDAGFHVEWQTAAAAVLYSSVAIIGFNRSTFTVGDYIREGR
jgi:hypothetical protein